MNGAAADAAATTIIKPTSINKIITGANQYFFLLSMKRNISFNIFLFINYHISSISIFLYV